MIIYRQDWIWRERGWGSEDDGYSLHIYQSDVTQYIKEYWDKMPDAVPDEYSCPSGPNYPVDSTDYDPEIIKTLKTSRNGVKV